jgi:hypothetical protein
MLGDAPPVPGLDEAKKNPMFFFQVFTAVSAAATAAST